MYKLPDLPSPQVIPALPKGAIELWLRALERPEADLKVKAADAFALAHRRGHKEASLAIPALLAALDRPEQLPAVRLALANALVTLDARAAAPSLFRELSTGDADLRSLVEPALARWDYAPARKLWLDRLGESAVPEQHVVLAMRGLAAVREAKAGDRLREMALSERLSGPLRLEAAAALAALRSEGLEADAEKLAANAGPRALPLRLAAATLLRRHQSPRAVEILQRLGADAEPAVAAMAITRLIEIDPALVVPALDRLLAHADSNLRSLAATVLFKKPSDSHLALLADLLDDVHPDVRVQARRALVDLAKAKEWRAISIAVASRMLQTDHWRALEQATIVLTQLDHKPAAQRFLELLDIRQSSRAEVYITAAWGLRKLDIPETLPAITQHAAKTYERFLASKSHQPPLALIDHHLSQLNQFIGQRKYAAAEPALRAFVPKRADRPMVEARAAAIWALGMIHEGKVVADLASALEERLLEETKIPPEDMRVRMMSAVTIGRMRTKDSLPSLRKFGIELEWRDSLIANACVWAISQITGEAVPPPKTLRPAPRDWFLVPD